MWEDSGCETSWKRIDDTKLWRAFCLKMSLLYIHLQDQLRFEVLARRQDWCVLLFSTGRCHDSCTQKTCEMLHSSKTLDLRIYHCEVPACQTCAVATRTLKPRLQRSVLSLSDPWVVWIIYYMFHTIFTTFIIFLPYSEIQFVSPLSFLGTSPRCSDVSFLCQMCLIAGTTGALVGRHWGSPWLSTKSVSWAHLMTCGHVPVEAYQKASSEKKKVGS